LSLAVLVGVTVGIKEEYEFRKITNEANRDKEQWWFNQTDPVARLTGWLMAFTGLLFLATIASVVALIVTDITLKDTMKASNRAWLAPMEGLVDGDAPIANQKFGYYVKFGNSGKEPALGMVA
jgi:choline-glycine betaine transporter